MKQKPRTAGRPGLVKSHTMTTPILPRMGPGGQGGHRPVFSRKSPEPAMSPNVKFLSHSVKRRSLISTNVASAKVGCAPR